MRAFGEYHPAAVAVCLMSCAGITMFSSNPVIALISLAGALTLWLVRNGGSNARSHLFFSVLLFAVPLVNMLVSHNGVTVLLVVNDNPVTLEALLYGLWAAVMLIAVLYWFRSFTQIMTSDRLLCLLGGLSPRLALMLTMALRFVPHLGQQAKKTENAQKALGLYKEDNFIDLIKGKLRVFSILITWALENGITTADSMSARGYGTGRRTTYSVYRFRPADVLVTVLSLVLLALCAAGLALGNGEYSFYPQLDSVPHSPWCIASYTCFGGLALLPSIIELEVKLRWHSFRSAI